MNEPGYNNTRFNHLNPTAQEFIPMTSLPFPPQIFYPNSYPPPPPPSFPAPSPAPTTSTPTRTLLLTMVPPTVSESTLRRDLELFGDVRAVQMDRRREGVIIIHFYDIRDSQSALTHIQNQHMQQQFRLRCHYDAVFNNYLPVNSPPPVPPHPGAPGLVSGNVVWAQFVSPVTSNIPDGNNQGTIVVFNLGYGVSAEALRNVFQTFGPVKEVRETGYNKTSNQRFVEFYDIRNAALAVAELNGKEIYGRTVGIEFSRPSNCGGGGQYHHSNNKFFKPQNRSTRNVDNSSNNVRVLSHSTPQPVSRQNLLSHNGRSGSKDLRTRGNPSRTSSGSSSFHDSMSNLCISSTSTRDTNTGYDHDRCIDHCSSGGGGKQKSKKNGGGGSCSKKSISPSSTTSGSGTTTNTSRGGGSRQERKPWKGVSGSTTRNGKDHDPHFSINEDAILESNSKDLRTTVMIKNIPNKYSQKLVLNMLDNHCIHCNEQIENSSDGGGGDEDQKQPPLSAYDFLYLPIDFINKCNVGYGFVNMTSPEATLRLYKAFHHQNWEVFNSRKICEVTYARLQGLDALREHFKNSKFPGNDEEYMPVVFSPPRDGRRKTEPMPIVGRPLDSPSSSSGASSSKESRPQQPLLLEEANNNHIAYDTIACIEDCRYVESEGS